MDECIFRIVGEDQSWDVPFADGNLDTSNLPDEMGKRLEHFLRGMIMGNGYACGGGRAMRDVRYANMAFFELATMHEETRHEILGGEFRVDLSDAWPTDRWYPQHPLGTIG